jgi:hypothetical protein
METPQEKSLERHTPGSTDDTTRTTTTSERNFSRDAASVNDSQYLNIPDELKELRQWMAFKFGKPNKHGKRPKIPKNPTTGRNAAVNRPTTWGTFAEAVHAVTRFGLDGLGFTFTENDPYAGIDLDGGCRDPATGELTAWAGELVKWLDSYTEASVSGTGVHILVKARLSGRGGEDGGIEMYDRGRYFVMTGEHLGGTPPEIEERQGAIDTLYAEHFSHKLNGTEKQDKAKKASPQHSATLQEVESALSVIPAVEHDVWLHVGMAIHAVDSGEAGFALWVEWSKSCPEKFDLDDCHTRWRSFSPAGGITAATIFGLARDHGWKNTADTPARTKTPYNQQPFAGNSSRHEPLTEEEENAIALAQERETTEKPDGATDEATTTTGEPDGAIVTITGGTAEPQAAKGTGRTEYMVPDILWQGIFAKAAEKMKLWTWEVWLGVFGALSARAHRNLHCHYYSDYIFGNSFSLLVNLTGAGKNLVVNIGRVLLGEDYKIRAGLNSGPALVPMLTDDPLKAKEGRLQVQGVPILLLSSEWSRIIQMSGIEHATLQEDLNDLFMRHHPWSQSRSHKNPSGGDIVISKPALTIVGTTTRKLFHGALTDKALGSGTINRYLIVPGSSSFQAYKGNSYRADTALTGLIDHLTNHTFGLGREVSELYSPDAWQAFLAFQEEFIVPLHNDPGTSEALLRLHVHLQHVAALYPWQMKSTFIELDHFNAAKAVIEISHRFVTELLTERTKTFEPTRVQEIESAMEKQVIAKLKKYPGLTRREFARKVAQDKGSYAAWAKTVESLIKAGAINIKPNGKREELYVLLGF